MQKFQFLLLRVWFEAPLLLIWVTWCILELPIMRAHTCCSYSSLTL